MPFSDWDKELLNAALASGGWMILDLEDRAVLADAMTAPDIPELSIAVPGLERMLRDEHYILDLEETLMIKELIEVHTGIAALASKGRELATRITTGKTPEELVVIHQEAEHLARVGLESQTRADRLRTLLLGGFRRAQEAFCPATGDRLN